MAAVGDISLKRRWERLSMPWRLVVGNVAVFLAIRLAGIVAMAGDWDIDAVVSALALPSSLSALAMRPWTLLTYMFTQYDVWHILFNMLVLYSFSSIFLWRCSPRQLFALYLFGGIAGAVLYLAGAALFPAVGGWLLGASASVMAVVMATAVMMPDFSINLLLFGSVRLKWVAVGAIVLFALGISGDNAGGHIAHLGGMALGFLFGVCQNRGVDILGWFNKGMDCIVNFIRRPAIRPPRKKFRPKPRPRAHPSAEQARQIDEILDKIKKSGYTSLTADEKKRLFETGHHS